MKKFSILSVAFLLLLTGCSSSLSLEDQTKLVEYEKCLENAFSLSLRDQEARGLGSYQRSQFLESWLEEAQNFSLEKCKKVRP